MVGTVHKGCGSRANGHKQNGATVREPHKQKGEKMKKIEVLVSKKKVGMVEAADDIKKVLQEQLKKERAYLALMSRQ